MHRVNSSHAALVISIAALFVALGGTAWAVTQIGTDQIQDGAVTSPKLHNGAVTKSKLAGNSVSNSKLRDNSISNSKLRNNSVSTSDIQDNAVSTSKIQDNAVSTSKIQDNAVTASKVAPNTFLAATGTAVDSARLGGLLPADFVNGVGFTENRHLVVPVGGSSPLFGAGFGAFSVSCSATGLHSVTWTPTVANAEYLADVQVFGAAPSIVTLNAIPASGSDSEPSLPGTLLPFLTTYQIGYTAGGEDHVATAFINGRFESGTGCVFVGQELSTG
jgi:hypothetical protein